MVRRVIRHDRRVRVHVVPVHVRRGAARRHDPTRAAALTGNSELDPVRGQKLDDAAAGVVAAVKGYTAGGKILPRTDEHGHEHQRTVVAVVFIVPQQLIDHLRGLALGLARE